MKRKKVIKFFASLLVAAVVTTSVQAPMMFEPIVAYAEDTSVILADYAFDSTSGWDNNNGKENNLSITTDEVPTVGTTLTMDVLIPGDEAPSFNNIIKPVGVLRIGSDWVWVQSNTIPELKAEDFSEQITINGNNYYKASVSIDFGETVGANGDAGWNGSMPFEDAVNDVVSAVTVQFAGWQCDYSGQIGIANAKLTVPASNTETVVKEWNFDSGIGSWENAGWDYQYDGTAATVASEFGALKVNVDYSGGIDNSWSQIGVREWGDIDVVGTTKTTFDLYYDPAQLTKGSLAIKEALQYKDGDNYPEAVSTDVTVDTSLAVDSDIEELAGWKKVPVTITYDAVDKNICNTVLCIVGKNTTYSGALYIDNLKMTKSAVQADDIYVDSTVTPTGQAVSVSGNTLTTNKKDNTKQNTTIPNTIKLVDENASANTKAVYAYLKAMGESDSVIFGHQNDTWHKAGSLDTSNSDTMDVVGSISGIVGIDTLSLTGNEYSASRYNSELGKDAEHLPENAKGNVAAAAKLTNYNIEQGVIITLSAHMPNFSDVKENSNYNAETDPTYAKYDFSGYTPNVIKNDVMNEILPGGKYNEQYNAYLDMIADYSSQVNGTILFRPFHENTGSWFWWGKAYCDSATYKNVYKYTVEYLRDTKNVHNMLYVYGPGSEAASTTEYGERYPGDNYVDMIGFDMYHSAPTENDSWFDSFKAELKIVNNFAKEHNKLIAVTETGVANSADKGDNQTALHKTGNEQKDWYNTMLDAVSDSSASYFLVWANFGKKDGFYTPYAESANDDGTLHGHEMLDNFISFYNDGRSIFAGDQKAALEAMNSATIDADSVSTAVDGYFTAPVSGKRILDATTITFNISKYDNEVLKVVCVNGDKKVELPVSIKAKSASNSYSCSCSVALSQDALSSLGAGVGTIELYANDKKLDSIKAIFNMEEPEKDPYEIDGFENYFGEDSLLQKEWATNKDSGCTIDISLSNEEGKHSEGEYSLKFTYDEKVGGWAGATIAKDVDWSDCNALSLWTIPDGKNQKVVIQITAGGKEYEAWLNTYDGYKDVTTPLYVTIPFDKFIDRDGDGPEGGLSELKGKINSVGLWVNQIGDEPVTGTIYYDKITAVKTDLTEVTFSDTDNQGGNENNNNNNNNSNNNSNNNDKTDTDKKDIIVSKTEKIDVNNFVDAVNSGVNVIIPVTDANGNELYRWTFDSKDINVSKLNGKKDIDLTVKFTTAKQAKIQSLVNGVGKALFIDIPNFDGELPGKATLSISVKDKYKDGQKVYLYYYDEKNNKVEKIGDALTVSNGKVDVQITHCSVYFLSDKADVTMKNTATSPKTGDSNGVFASLASMLAGLTLVGAAFRRKKNS